MCESACACRHKCAMVCKWKSEGSLKYRSPPGTLFKAGSLVQPFCQANQFTDSGFIYQSFPCCHSAARMTDTHFMCTSLAFVGVMGLELGLLQLEQQHLSPLSYLPSLSWGLSIIILHVCMSTQNRRPRLNFYCLSFASSVKLQVQQLNSKNNSQVSCIFMTSPLRWPLSLSPQEPKLSLSPSLLEFF